MSTENLATFLHRHAMVYERHYPHPIDLVWEAVSTGEHLDVWLLPVTTVERRPGGRATFTWGSPAGEGEQVAEVTVFEPPTSIQFTFGNEVTFMRFDLRPDGDGTHLAFTHSYAPGGEWTEQDDSYEGADQPAGPDTPWRPGFLAGFHSMLDRLGPYLAGDWTTEDASRELVRQIEQGFDERGHELMAVYREHVRNTCPPA